MLRVPNASLKSGFSIRFGAICAALLMAVATVTAVSADDALASGSDETAFVTALNQVRANVGLPALTLNSQLSDLSRGHAQVMADAGGIFHADPISAGYNGPWSKMGENVGKGGGVQILVDAFVASPGHYSNIIDPDFTQIGVGVVWVGNALYTTHRFIKVPGQTATTTTTAPPATTAPPVTAPPVTAPPPTTTARANPTPSPPLSTVPPSTTLPPLAPPSIDAARVVILVGMVELVGT
ncbi:MAG: CAP domain-containing protein [Acidimicrobiales bacterium]|nr:CAP domain-containing protein [Acidimicrobiales bacterium]